MQSSGQNDSNSQSMSEEKAKQESEQTVDKISEQQTANKEQATKVEQEE